jgi:hypothetical protein
MTVTVRRQKPENIRLLHRGNVHEPDLRIAAAHLIEAKTYQQSRAAGQWLSRRQGVSARELYRKAEMRFSCKAYENFLLVARIGFPQVLDGARAVRARPSNWGS